MQNAVFILTDQWPAWAFGFLGADIPTPNIDRLASEGTVFTNAFTSCPLCTPARGSLLTARWPHQNGVYDNQSVGYSLQESIPWWGCMDTSPLDKEEWKTVIAYSHAHITMVDEAIGRILDALDRLDLADTTTVIFTSDHGDMEGAHNRFDKGAYFYEEVWRIPFIIRAPNQPTSLFTA